MSQRISAKQRAALQAVAGGRVAYGDPHPARLRRAVERAQRRADAGETDSAGITGGRRPVIVSSAALSVSTFIADGHEVYAGEHSTYGSLSERGWIDAATPDGYPRPVTLTDAGLAAFGLCELACPRARAHDDKHAHCPRCGLAIWANTEHECPPGFREQKGNA